jgi:siroheme synthase-like protein
VEERPVDEELAVGSARFGYPVALDVHGVAVLVVGGGPVAARKVDGLAAAGAEVRVVALDVGEDMARAVGAGRVHSLARRAYRRDDIEGVRLVVTATGDPEVDGAVARDATAANVWVNAADQREHCTFILPAVARCGPVSAAVSTDGASPALAGRLRDHIAGLLTDDVAALAVRLAAERAAIRAGGGSTEDHDWAGAIDAVLPRRLVDRGGQDPG